MNPKYLIIWIVLLIVAFFVPSETLLKDGVWWYELISFIALLAFVKFNRDSTKGQSVLQFKPVYLFLLAYYIVFFQRPIDYILGFVDGWYYIGRSDLMLPSLKYSTIGIICFYIGYSYQDTKVSKYQNDTLLPNQIASTKIYSVATSVLLLLIIIFVPKSVLLGGYGQQMLTNASSFNYLSSWCSSFIIAYFIQFCINKKCSNNMDGYSISQFVREVGAWQLINIVLYAYIILNVGDRGPLIVVCLAFYLCYIVICKTKIPKLFIITALTVGIMGTMFLGLTKQFRGNNSFSDRVNALVTNSAAIGYISICPPTYELSVSYNCLPFAIEIIEGHQDYGYGTLQIGGLLSTIPFVNRFLNLPTSSSYQISHFVQGDEITFGNGTNCIADLYLDGGLLLIIIGMLFWGRLLNKFENVLFGEGNSSLFIFCMAFFFLSHVVYIPRSTILSPLKYALWIYIIMCINKKMFKL